MFYFTFLNDFFVYLFFFKLVNCLWLPNRAIITATASGELKLWNPTSMQAMGTLQGHKSSVSNKKNKIKFQNVIFIYFRFHQ